MAANQVAARASEVLMRDREVLAQDVTARLYREQPGLLDRWGERGRAKTLQDMRHNIDHLIPAVDMADASMFVRYTEWLEELMDGLNVPRSLIVRCYELLRDAVSERYDAAERGAIVPIIDDGIDHAARGA